MKTAKKQYIGEQEVKSIEGTKVTFIDGTEKEYTTKQLEYIVTEESTDPTAERDLMIKNVVPEMMEILTNHDIKKVDLTYIYEMIVSSYNDLFFKALGKAFGTYKEGLHPAFFQENIRVSDIKRLSNK